MESKDELKEINIKNRTCCYFDDITRVIDTDFSDILLTEESWRFKQNFSGCKTVACLGW